MSRLILGTAQFGLDYGVTNSGQVSPQQAGEILAAAAQVGITTVDTAAAYGSSEKVLSQHQATRHFRVITKLPPQQRDSAPLLAQFEQRCSQLDGAPEAVLFHRADDLLIHARADHHWLAAEHARGQGLCRRIGVSVYHPDELVELLNRYPLQLVQFPASWLDRRFLTPELLQRLASAKVEIHARSLLLQGVLAQSAPARHPWFSQFPPLAAFDQHCAQLDAPPLAVALALLQHYPQLQGVLGCNSAQQLRELAWAAGQDLKIEPSQLLPGPELLVLPYLWPKLRPVAGD